MIILSILGLAEVLSYLCYISKGLDFFGGPVVKNLSANAGNVGWIPDLGRSHMLLGD